MATATLTPAPAPQPQKRITVEEYRQLIDEGLVSESARFELIRGLLVEKPAINPPRATSLSRMRKRITRFETDEILVRIEAPITLTPDSGPVPDFVVAKGSEDDYEDRHPEPGDIYLVVEVADSSLAVDRGIKLQLYAEFKLPEYWIVNIPDRRVEVYAIPRVEGGYSSRRDYLPGESVPLSIEGKILGSIPVREILPR